MGTMPGRHIYCCQMRLEATSPSGELGSRVFFKGKPGGEEVNKENIAPR